MTNPYYDNRDEYQDHHHPLPNIAFLCRKNYQIDR